MKNLWYILLISFILACQGNISNVQKIYKTTFLASGEADSINLKYTDSGKVQSTLQAQKMLDYSSAKNPFIEFPKGILVRLYDNKGNITTVTSDKAFNYRRTQIIDLQGNVVISTHDGKVLKTPQLFYDQKNEWFFTEEQFEFVDNQGGFLQGVGIDFSKDFKVFNMQNNTGQVNNIK